MPPIRLLKLRPRNSETSSVGSDLISHIGIAVADLEKSIRLYESLTGHEVGGVSDVADQNVRVAMFGGHNSARIELVAASAPDSPIARFIAKNGEGLHHVCIFVDDIESRLAELKAKGFRLIDEEPRIGRLLDMLEDFNLGLVDNWLDKVGVQWLGFAEDLAEQRDLVGDPQRVLVFHRVDRVGERAEHLRHQRPRTDRLAVAPPRDDVAVQPVLVLPVDGVVEELLVLRRAVEIADQAALCALCYPVRPLRFIFIA